MSNCNDFLRHTLATIAYRFQKSVSKSTEDFGDFSLGQNTRSASEIVNHMYQVLNTTRFFIQKEDLDRNTPERLSLGREIVRFNNELRESDKVLEVADLDPMYTFRLLQGPLSDILTHIGQLSMMSRVNGNPIAGEDFSSAPIKIGQLSYF